IFFFFSSRRRHTRFSRDWSSDVCSSDLGPAQGRHNRRYNPIDQNTSSSGYSCEAAAFTMRRRPSRRFTPFLPQVPVLISTANITMQFGARPLFENVSVKFGNGNRYVLIGANGCGKSTFKKSLGGALEPSAGPVMLEPNSQLGKLRQDQFAYEDFSVIDAAIMGHAELWQVKAERDRIYSLAQMSEEDGMAVAELEVQFAEMDGYTAESRAGELLLGLGIPLEQHFGPMSEVAPGWKLRVLLAQALFSDPDVLLLDEPTNHLDIHTIRWLEGVLR